MGAVRAAQRVVDWVWRAGQWAGDRPDIRAANELRTMDVDDLAEAIRGALGGGPSSSGIDVTVERALSQPAYWSSLIVLAESVAQLPFNVMKPTADGRGAEIAREAPVHKLLAKRGKPNGWQSSFDFRHLMMWQLLNRGDFYALKNFVRDELDELIPLHPTQVKVEQDDDFRVTYRVKLPSGNRATFTRARIFHLMGPSDSGVSGVRPLAHLREPIGLAAAQDLHAGKLFANGARLWGVLEHPGKLNDEVTTRLREQFAEVFAGWENAHKTAVLEEGMSWKPVSQNAEETQLMESRKLQRGIVASTRRVPPHMIGDLDKASFSNIEQQSLEFVIYTLLPHLERFEQAADLQLLSEAEREAGLYCKFNVAGLLRGDLKAQGEFLTKMIAARVMNPNEAREKLDMNPYEGGDDFANPNITTEPSSETPPDDEAEDDGGDDAEAARRARLSLVRPGD